MISANTDPDNATINATLTIACKARRREPTAPGGYRIDGLFEVDLEMTNAQPPRETGRSHWVVAGEGFEPLQTPLRAWAA